MKLKKYVLLIFWMFGILLNHVNGQTSKIDATSWRIGAQTYTFNHFSFVETLDKLKELNLHYAEIYFGQTLGKGFGDKVMDFKLDLVTQNQILKLAKAKNVKIIACGVVVCSDEAEWKQLFEFAKHMGIETITSEPTHEQLRFVDQLANQYKIDIAIHNHPKPSTYWNPDSFLLATKGLSNRIGSCADVGHWKRMGIDPVEALKKLHGKIKILHFKDVKAPESGEEEQHDVIWGQGVCNVEGLLKELKNQHFKGAFSIEYEYNWDNSVPDIKKCIQYFRAVKAKLPDAKHP